MSTLISEKAQKVFDYSFAAMSMLFVRCDIVFHFTFIFLLYMYSSFLLYVKYHSEVLCSVWLLLSLV